MENNSRTKVRFSLYLLLAALLLSISGCGGGAGITSPATGNGAGTGTATGNTTDSRILPLGSALPSLPSDISADSAARTSSAAQDYSGAAFIQAAGATIDGDGAILQSSASEPAWALYKLDGLQGKYVASFSVAAAIGAEGQQYSVGLSNFSDGRWQYFITGSAATASVDLKPNTKRLISLLGNLYYIVVVSGGDSVRVGNATLDVSDTPPPGSVDQRPGLPMGLFASRGEPQVTLTWLADPDATGYEVYRRAAAPGDHRNWRGFMDHGRPPLPPPPGEGDGTGTPPPPGGGNGDGTQPPPPPGGGDGTVPPPPPGGGNGDGTVPPPPPGGGDDDGGAVVPAEFELLATTTDPTYVDTTAVLDTFYEYKVRALSAAGESADSGIALGIATNNLRVMGKIVSISTGSIMVDGSIFAITEGTQFIGKDGTAATLADFAAGDQVGVEGLRQADGSFAAVAVRAIDRAQFDPGLGHFAAGGKLSAIDGATLTITMGPDGEHTASFTYDANTHWLLADGTAGTAADFAAGDDVCVFADGDPHAAGAYAKVVQKRPAPPAPPAE